MYEILGYVVKIKKLKNHHHKKNLFCFTNVIKRKPECFVDEIQLQCSVLGSLKLPWFSSILLLTKLCNILEFDFSPREFFQEKIKIFITKPTPYSLKMHILSMEGIHIWILVAFPFFQYIIFRFHAFENELC